VRFFARIENHVSIIVRSAALVAASALAAPVWRTFLWVAGRVASARDGNTYGSAGQVTINAVSCRQHPFAPFDEWRLPFRLWALQSCNPAQGAGAPSLASGLLRRWQPSRIAEPPTKELGMSYVNWLGYCAPMAVAIRSSLSLAALQWGLRWSNAAVQASIAGAQTQSGVTLFVGAQ
jgi:hypothetical protein